MKILLIGPPGSGKGTVGKLLSSKIKLPIISTGQLLRDLPKNAPHYDEIHEVMDEGGLPSNKWVGVVLGDELKKNKYSEGYILDGWCRKAEDLQQFDPNFNLVIYLDISRETSIKRLSSRLVCKKVGHVFNTKYKRPKKEGICDIDGSVLVSREDDELKDIGRRLDIFYSESKQVTDIFKRKGILIKIDAEPLPDKIFKNVVSKLGI